MTEENIANEKGYTGGDIKPLSRGKGAPDEFGCYSNRRRWDAYDTPDDIPNQVSPIRRGDRLDQRLKES